MSIIIEILKLAILFVCLIGCFFLCVVFMIVMIIVQIYLKSDFFRIIFALRKLNLLNQFLISLIISY